MERQKVLEERLVVLGSLSDDIEDQFGWLTRTRVVIEEGEDPGQEMQDLIEAINKIKVCCKTNNFCHSCYASFQRYINQPIPEHQK